MYLILKVVNIETKKTIIDLHEVLRNLWSIHANLDEEFCMKIVALNGICGFVIHDI
jgi:hypothetical protein